MVVRHVHEPKFTVGISRARLNLCSGYGELHVQSLCVVQMVWAQCKQGLTRMMGCVDKFSTFVLHCSSPGTQHISLLSYFLEVASNLQWLILFCFRRRWALFVITIHTSVMVYSYI